MEDKKGERKIARERKNNWEEAEDADDDRATDCVNGSDYSSREWEREKKEKV